MKKLKKYISGTGIQIVRVVPNSRSRGLRSPVTLREIEKQHLVKFRLQALTV